jgi:hypothetical protein
VEQVLPGGGLAPVVGRRWRERRKEDEYDVRNVYVNAEMISAETIPGIRGRMKESSRGGELFKYDIFDTLLKPL